MPVDETIEQGAPGADSVDEHPQALPDPDEGEVPTYGKDNEELPEQLVKALRAAVEEYQAQDPFDRRREVMRDRKNRFYYRSYQHIYEDNRTGFFIQGVAGSTYTVGGSEVQAPSKIDDYNIFKPYLRTVSAVLTQNQPGIDFLPNNESLAEDIEAADTSEGYRHIFDRANDTKGLQKKAVRMLGLSGRTVSWTRTEANAQKFGYKDGQPKKMETCDIYGTIENKVQITAKSQNDTPYCFLTDDLYYRVAKTEYPTFAEKIQAGQKVPGESEYERYARLGIMQGTRQMQVGNSLQFLVSRLNGWMRPATFTGKEYDDPFEGDGSESEPMTVHDKLGQLFPSGCHVVFVGDQYCGSWNESLDDKITIEFPDEGDGMHRPALMDDVVVVQDRFNDDMNAYASVKDDCWPSTWVNADDQEWDAIGNQISAPGMFRLKKASTGRPLNEQFHKEDGPEIPPTLFQSTEYLQGPLAQFMLAAQPALFGAGDTDNKTASGIAQLHATAVGQQGITWSAVQRLFASIYKQAALCATRNPDHAQEIAVPGKNGTTTTLNLQRITKDRFGCYPDQDSSFPESTAAKRAQLTNLATMAAQTPVGQQLFDSPDNWEQFNELLGFAELTLPEAESRNKQVSEIEQLLQEKPLPPSPEALQQAAVAHAAETLTAQGSGMPPPPPFDPTSLLQPSVPVDDLDYHAYEGRKGRDWLSSPDCRKQIAAGNVDGVLNVKLHTKLHLAKAALEAPPPMPMPAGKPQPGKPAAPAGVPSVQKTALPPGAPGALTM